MTWFMIALIAPILWSFVNHADKLLLSKYVKGQELGSLMIYSCLFAVLVLPIAYIIKPAILAISTLQIVILIIAGVLEALAVYLYLVALNDEETSVVIPFFQSIPIFAFILGYFVLGEIVTTKYILASLVTILGGILLSFEITAGNKIVFKKKMVLAILASSFIFALHRTLFKLASVTEDFWISIFWQSVGLVIVGLFLLFVIKKYREQFMVLLRENGVPIFLLNMFSEGFTTAGNILFAYALLLAPIGLVMTVEAYQPVFAFLLGILLTIFFPQIAKEKIGKGHIFKRGFAIALVFAGSLFLYTN